MAHAAGARLSATSTHIVESRQMNPTARVLILMALSLLLASTIPVFVTASTF
jgi:hypothetical protein